MEAGGGKPSLLCLGGKNFALHLFWCAADEFGGFHVRLLLNTVVERKSCVLPMSVSAFFPCGSSPLSLGLMFIHSGDSARLMIPKEIQFENKPIMMLPEMMKVESMQVSATWRNAFWSQLPPGTSELHAGTAGGHIALGFDEVKQKSISSVGPTKWGC
ncbi:hypothetical protein PIB30_081708, partial [Stylosanthes scabra]|nr:hypothetical protein [Stylosanthes scabra]